MEAGLRVPTKITVTGNGAYGIYVNAEHARVLNSVVTGNGDLDVSSSPRPTVVSTTCGHSGGGTKSPTWLVCSGD